MDTSSSASFPTVDWQITANESANGGANKFSIDDIDNSRTPFTIEASTPNNQLYLDNAGRVGFGTATPALQLHQVHGNTPALRLEQDGTFGFTPQSWDIAGNEANFFVRDNTNGGALPFRIIPGAATNSLFVAADGDVGLGISAPTGAFHIANTAGAGTADDFVVENDGTILVADGTVGAPGIRFGKDGDTGIYRVGANELGIATAGVKALSVDATGAVVFNGLVGVGTAATNILTVEQSSATDPVADAWTVYSSRRWKTDVAVIEDAVANVEALRGVTYRWKETGVADIGLIAEEVGAVFPEIVTWEENGVDAQSVDYARLVAVLIEAVKAQQVVLDSRGAEVSALEARLGRLERLVEEVARR